MLIDARKVIMITKNNELKTSSRKVAEVFEKSHKNVLQDIDKTIRYCSLDFNRLNFQLVNYKDKLEYPVFTNAVQNMINNSESENTKRFGYNHENNLIYLVVLGMNAEKFRRLNNLEKGTSIRGEHLTPSQIKEITHMQRLDTSLIDLGMDYDERKAKLKEMYNKFYSPKKLN